MPAFQMVTDLPPQGDQPQAIAGLTESLRAGHRYQTLLGVTGSGKSVVATTPVLVRRGEIVALEPIGSLVDSLLANCTDRVRRVGDTEMLQAGDAGEPVEVLSFDPLTGAVGWKPITEFLRHRSPPTLWEVETACGRTVTATGDHNFFVLREGDLRLARTVDVRPGDHLPIPRHIPEPMVPLGDLGLADGFGDRRVYVTVPHFSEVWETEADTLRPLLTQAKVRALVEGRERVAIPLYRHLVAAVPALVGDARFGTRRRTYEMPAALPITADLLRLLGYYVAEGHAEDRYCILSSADPEIADAVLRTARSLGLRTHRRPETYDYQIYSRLWAGLLARWCGRDARSKRLPPLWLQLSDADLARLLAAYFAADGGVDGDGVTCVTASQQLASDLSYALLRFDIVARLRRRRMRVPGKGERRTYWRLSISGQPFLKKFHDLIGFGLPRKDARLRAIIAQNENTNVDVIPLSGQALRRVRTILGLIQREVAARAGCVRPMLSLIEHGRRRPSRTLAERLLAALKAEAAGQGCSEALRDIGQMEGLLNLFWTPVRTVAEVPGESFVYDLAVAENENFLAGWGGLFVHNTYTVARVVEQIQRPTLVLAHNKTLAAQLYGEFREFFPHNAVRYFVSYYDYYQPEAYVPQTDLYIAKDAAINEEIDRLRHASTKALMERRDVIVVASVSCIYGLGRPEDYREVMLLLRKGERRSRDEIVRRLVEIQYERNDIDFARGRFRVRGDVVEVFPTYEERAVRVDLYGDEIERIVELDPLTGEVFEHKDAVALWPAKHWVTTEERLERALASIEAELQERLAWFRSQGKLLEAQRLEFRTRYDMELLREAGTCPGIENYSRHLDGRAPGERPGCLLDYFPRDFLLFADESHVTLPQVRGMLEGDRSRKRNLVEFGFRLPSACDNRPLAWEEFDALVPQAVFVSATPGPYEMEVSQRVVEQVVRPTGLVDPCVEVRPAQGQVDDLIGEIKGQVARGERTLVTTLTKRMAEDLSAYLGELGLKVHYLHSEVDTLQRVQILKDLRLGAYDVLVGINLLREGLDLPEVSLVAILDADREGFLRSETALTQTMGRAARHISGRVLLYADDVTDSMRRAIAETNRRREVQVRYNAEHGITPASVSKPIRDMLDLQQVAEEIATYQPSSELLTAEELIRLAETQRAKVPWDVARLLMLSPVELEQTVEALERAMRRAAAELQFEKAAVLRDQIAELRKGMGEPFFAPVGRGRGAARGGRGRPSGRGRGAARTGAPRGRYPRRR